MRELDVRLDEIDGQIAAVAWSVVEPAARIGKAIGSSAELNEVMLRTLAAAGAVRAAEGSSISVRRPDGTVATAFSNVDPKGPVLTAVESSTGLTVPLGVDHSGSLTVYSRHPHGFDAECVELLTAIAGQAAPAVRRALFPGDLPSPSEQRATANAVTRMSSGAIIALVVAAIAVAVIVVAVARRRSAPRGTGRDRDDRLADAVEEMRTKMDDLGRDLSGALERAEREAKRNRFLSDLGTSIEFDELLDRILDAALEIPGFDARWWPWRNRVGRRQSQPAA